MQVGTLDHLKRRWFGNGRQQCSDGAVFRPLTLADLLAVLVITPLAAAGCCLLLAAELLSRRLRRRLEVGAQLLPVSGDVGRIWGGGRRHRQRALSEPSLKCSDRGVSKGMNFYP